MSELVPDSEHVPANLLADVRALIDEARRQTSAAVNVGMTLTYWRVGQRIRVDVLGGTRAAYGERIVSTLSRQLMADYGRSFSTKNLRHRCDLPRAFPMWELSRHCRDN